MELKVVFFCLFLTLGRLKTIVKFSHLLCRKFGGESLGISYFPPLDLQYCLLTKPCLCCHSSYRRGFPEKNLFFIIVSESYENLIKESFQHE